MQFKNCRRPGGDRIYGVFDNQLPSALRKLPFDRHLSVQNVKRVVSQADGYQPHLIAPEQGYRRLIESALNYFRGPAEASVDAVRNLLPVLIVFCTSFHQLKSLLYITAGAFCFERAGEDIHWGDSGLPLAS